LGTLPHGDVLGALQLLNRICLERKKRRKREEKEKKKREKKD
jgi:hypothetical protein